MAIRARNEGVKLIKNQLTRDDKQRRYGYWHYGRVELRILLDFIYGEKPQTDDEKIIDKK